MLAIRIEPSEDRERYLLRRAGYADPLVLFGRAEGGPFAYSPYNQGGCRTQQVAHEYIEQHWDELQTGEVIDVEFILGESAVKKLSEELESVF